MVFTTGKRRSYMPRAHTQTDTQTHTHTHTYMFRASRGTHQSVLGIFYVFPRSLFIHRVARFTGLSQSEDLRHLSVCREREISHREKKGRTQTSVTPVSRPFQGNSTPKFVLVYTRTRFKPYFRGNYHFRAKIIWSVEHALLHYFYMVLTLFLRPRTTSLLTRTRYEGLKCCECPSEVSLYKCTHTHTHTHIFIYALSALPLLWIRHISHIRVNISQPWHLYYRLYWYYLVTH